MVSVARDSTVLVIDDEDSMREGCRQVLADDGYRAEVAENGEQGLRLVRQLGPRIVLVDLKMPGIGGLEVLARIREIDPSIATVVITGYGTIDSAVEAMRTGASDYLCKPFDDKVLLGAVERGVKRRGLDTGPPEEEQGLIPGLGEWPVASGEAVARVPVITPIPRAGQRSGEPAEPKGFLSPSEVARKVVEAARSKCGLSILQMMLLGLLAGVYIGFGAELSTMVVHDLSRHVGVGLAKFVGGSVFSVGLMLVVLGGAELFTGNCLIAAGVLDGTCSARGLIRNWTIVYFANFAGSLLLALIMYYSGLWRTGHLGVGAAALRIASAKVDLSFSEAFLRGVGCNWLVCLAVWLAVAGKDAVSKILGIYFPIMAFVASGFEHSVANMYFIPAGLLLKAHPVVVEAAGLSGGLGNLTWARFLTANLVPVTLGNVVGGALFVAGTYYLVYLRRN